MYEVLIKYAVHMYSCMLHCMISIMTSCKCMTVFRTGVYGIPPTLVFRPNLPKQNCDV